MTAARVVGRSKLRLGVVFERVVNSRYRAIEPMKAMIRRGHEVVWPESQGEALLRMLERCDVVHVYRSASPETQHALKRLTRQGVPITYDNDDDLASMPEEAPLYAKHGGLRMQQAFGMTVAVARLAHVVTTPSDVLAEKYRRAGVERVEVIPNCLEWDANRLRSRHAGIVVGWVAAREHRADTARIDISGALARIVAQHPDVRVESIGVDLGLPDRYTHDPRVPFNELPRRMGAWDIGIAPLADIPWNHSRSDIKVKEYAASGLAWLASPVGPYRGLGEEQGGRLVPDDGWYEALDRLVRRKRERRKLARKGKKWAEQQTISSMAERWEQVFTEAAETAR